MSEGQLMLIEEQQKRLRAFEALLKALNAWAADPSNLTYQPVKKLIDELNATKSLDASTKCA